MIDNGVSIVTCTCKPHCLETIINNYTRQVFSNKELILVINNNDINIDSWIKKTNIYDNIRVFRTDESVSLGESLNFGIMQSKFDYISKFDDDDYYGPDYLVNIVKALEDTNADIIGKSSIFVYFDKTKILATHKRGSENNFVNKFIAGATITTKKEVFDKVSFQHLPSGVDRIFITECLLNKFKIYSTDIYDYVCIRYGDIEKHTWKIEDEAFMDWCTPIQTIENPDFYSITNKEIEATYN